MVISKFDLNFFFRNGDFDHSFAHGQNHVPGWRGRTENEVILDRVERGLKPVGQIRHWFGVEQQH